MSSRIKVDSDFDSGNGVLVSCEELSANNFECTVKTTPDAKTKTSRSWYHFRVHGVKKNDNIKFVVKNTSNLRKLYSQGHKPVFKSSTGKKWKKCHNCEFHYEQKRFIITFSHKFKKKGTYYFAYSYPFSYTDLQRKIQKIRTKLSKNEDFYFHHDVMIKTLEGRNLDCITISSCKGITDELEDEVCDELYPVVDDMEGKNKDRCRKFENKRIYLLTSRIHSGESPSSWIMNGFIDFITHPTDPRAVRLRDSFVFKFIPMLNPDGVANGHWRFHSLGFELNGCYYNPEEEEEPTIFATRNLINYLWVFENLEFYVDLHSHVNMKNAFIFGNAHNYMKDQKRNLLYPKLVTMNTQHVDFNRCNFSYKRMENFTGTSRVVLFSELGVLHAYTLEVNFHSGDTVNRLGDINNFDETKFAKEMPYHRSATTYTYEHFKDIGKGLAVALYDYRKFKKYSRIQKSELKSMDGVKKWLQMKMNGNAKLWRGSARLKVTYKYSEELLRLRKTFPKVGRSLLCRLLTKNKGKMESVIEDLTAE